MSAIEWTEAHKREALRALLRRAERNAGVMPVQIVRAVRIGARSFATERGFRRALRHLPAREIRRELRRVDGLATGRLVRETVWRSEYDDGGQSTPVSSEAARELAADARADGEASTVVRVTRVRRAP